MLVKVLVVYITVYLCFTYLSQLAVITEQTLAQLKSPNLLPAHVDQIAKNIVYLTRALLEGGNTDNNKRLLSFHLLLGILRLSHPLFYCSHSSSSGETEENASGETLSVSDIIHKMTVLAAVEASQSPKTTTKVLHLILFGRPSSGHLLKHS